MTDYTIKLASTLPKGSEPNGFDDATLARELCAEQLRSGTTRPRVAILVYDVKTAERMQKGGYRATVETVWVEPVDTDDSRRAVEKILAAEFLYRTGAAMLPHELATALKAAFADLPRTPEEIDEQQERERDSMSPTDELRRHLEVVHSVDGALSLTALEAETEHQASHDRGDLGPLAHNPDWLGWTRADLEAEDIDVTEQPAVDDADPGDEAGRVILFPLTDDDRGEE